MKLHMYLLHNLESNSRLCKMSRSCFIFQVKRIPGGWSFQILRQLADDGGMIVSSIQGLPLPPGNFPGTHFCYRLSQFQGHSVAGRILLKNSNDTIGNWTHDFLACRAVPQRTALVHVHILTRSWVEILAQRLAFLAEVCHNSTVKFWVTIPYYAVSASFHSFPNSLFMNHYKISYFAVWATRCIIQWKVKLSLCSP